MAKELGHEEDIPELQSEIDLLSKVVNERLWSEKDAFYYDEWRNGQRSGVMSIAAYWALLAEVVPPERMARFIAHLDNEEEFKRPNSSVLLLLSLSSALEPIAQQMRHTQF